MLNFLFDSEIVYLDENILDIFLYSKIAVLTCVMILQNSRVAACLLVCSVKHRVIGHKDVCGPAVRQQVVGLGSYPYTKVFIILKSVCKGAVSFCTILFLKL